MNLAVAAALPFRSVFNALIAAIYLTLGMREVYRLLFEVFGINPRAKEFQPKPRSQLEDVDFLSPELEKELSWEDIASYQVCASGLACCYATHHSHHLVMLMTEVLACKVDFFSLNDMYAMGGCSHQQTRSSQNRCCSEPVCLQACTGFEATYGRSRACRL